MKHLDLFSGIGGFSLAVNRVWHEEENEHTFVEYDPFCQAVLKKHWPQAEIHGDIRTFVADTERSRHVHGQSEIEPAESSQQTQRQSVSSIPTSPVFLITGGFPCQPFSQAGRRKGTADDRYLWPPMFECIALFRPRWVIAENVAGLATWSEGLVLETVCSDLEKEGYEVQPLIIPAVAVNAPHRRDRVWIVANRISSRTGSAHGNEIRGSKQRRQEPNVSEGSKIRSDITNGSSSSWNKNWLEVATRLCRVDDGLPRRLDRNPRLKALGNAIVPQVAEEILKAIKAVTF